MIRKLTTSPVSTPPRGSLSPSIISLSSTPPPGFRKRVDSISLLKNMHGCNTLPDDDLDSPYGSPSSPYASSPLDERRNMKRVDSVTLLRRLNNLNTSEEINLEKGVDRTHSPRSSKIKSVNESFSKKTGEGKSRRSESEKNIWVGGELESTTYFTSVQNSSPMLERRDSITLQHTMQGMNTIYGVHSESPRWKKVAGINRKRVAKKMREKKGEIDKAVGVGKIGLNIESDEEEEEEEEEEERLWAKSREERTSRGKMDSISLHNKMGGFNTKESGGIRLRNRVDSVQLHKSRGGNNTVDTLGAPRRASPTEGKEEEEQEKEEQEEGGGRSKFFGRKGKELGGSLSPRLVRVRELNSKYKDNDDTNVGRGQKKEGGKRATRKSAPPSTTFVFGDEER
ncbi:hypothetical protein TL16_g07288 [Triparma laevis f. inornata]|uniref:Uncharacterized protein n=1 Tax=Triparma laevis f. inornata TaxID=1714386 RepID=A0A9W7ARM5_9STRA|nr:hypothetical protein TL16_g07288 [Triparma laevis f. inornata]